MTCVCVCVHVYWGEGSGYLEQGVVLEESADYFVGVFCSIFEDRRDLDSDGWSCGRLLFELEIKSQQLNTK